MLRRNFMIHEALCYVKEKETVVCAFSLRRSFDMTFPYHLVMMKRMNEDKWGEKTNAKVAQKKFDVMRNQLYFLALRSIINWGCWCVCSVPVFIVLWRHCRESQVGSFLELIYHKYYISEKYIRLTLFVLYVLSYSRDFLHYFLYQIRMMIFLSQP